MKKALIIGINDYPGSPLFGCVNDAKAVEAILQVNGDGSPNMETDLQTNVPTRARLLELVAQLFSGSRLVSLLYFSGHGYYNNRNGFLVTPDAKAYDEGVRMDDIIQLANASEATNKVIILDCCFSGALAEGNAAGGTSISIREGVTILTASRKSEPAMEAGGQGLFTGLLLQALSGGAADIRGHVSPGSIYAYIDQALGESGQRPVFKTNIIRFISLRDVVPQLAPGVLRKLTEYFPDPGQPHLLDPSYEDTNTPEWEPLKMEPYAIPENVKRFKDLQQLQSVGLLVPEDAPFMYFAAMRNKSCRLTPLGLHYWNLVKKRKV